MSFFRITFANRRPGRHVCHRNGSQRMYAEIMEIAPCAIERNDVPLALELDGWADDQACVGDVYDTDEGFSVECITEEEYREETGQEDTPTYLLG